MSGGYYAALVKRGSSLLGLGTGVPRDLILLRGELLDAMRSVLASRTGARAG